jgi:hypothetical protein
MLVVIETKILVDVVMVSPFLKATKALRESRGIALLCFWTLTLEGDMESASRPGRFLPPEKTRYPLYRRLGGPQAWSEQVQKILPPLGFDPWTAKPVASHYTDWVTRPTLSWCWYWNIPLMNRRNVSEECFCTFILYDLKFCTVTISEIINLQMVFNATDVGVFFTCHCTVLDVPDSNG